MFKKVGGLYHFRFGRIGGSFYIAKLKRKSAAKAIDWQSLIAWRLPMIAAIAIAAPLSADAMPKHRHFVCPELRGLPHSSAAYRDTLDACLWDFQHPIKGK